MTGFESLKIRGEIPWAPTAFRGFKLSRIIQSVWQQRHIPLTIVLIVSSVFVCWDLWRGLIVAKYEGHFSVAQGGFWKEYGTFSTD